MVELTLPKYSKCLALWVVVVPLEVAAAADVGVVAEEDSQVASQWVVKAVDHKASLFNSAELRRGVPDLSHFQAPE